MRKIILYTKSAKREREKEEEEKQKSRRERERDIGGRNQKYCSRGKTTMFMKTLTAISAMETNAGRGE